MQGVWGTLNPKYTERGAVLVKACSQQQWKAKQRSRKDEELSLFSGFVPVSIKFFPSLTYMAVQQAAFVRGNPFWLLEVFNRHFKLRKSRSMQDMKRGKRRKKRRGWNIGEDNREGEKTQKNRKGNQSVSCSRTLSISITVCQCLQPHSLWVDKKHANVRNSEGYATLPVSASYMLMSRTHRAWGQATRKHMRQIL